MLWKVSFEQLAWKKSYYKKSILGDKIASLKWNNFVQRLQHPKKVARIHFYLYYVENKWRSVASGSSIEPQVGLLSCLFFSSLGARKRKSDKKPWCARAPFSLANMMGCPVDTKSAVRDEICVDQRPYHWFYRLSNNKVSTCTDAHAPHTTISYKKRRKCNCPYPNAPMFIIDREY